MTFALGLALTNYRVNLHKLRTDDKDWFNRHRNRMFEIGEAQKRNNNEAQAIYRSKRRARLNKGYCPIVSDDETQNLED